MALGLLNTTTPPIAVDFGVASMKALQIAQGDHPSLIAASCVETPQELRGDPIARLQFQLDALPSVVRKGKFRGKRIMVSAPAEHTWVQHMQIQRAPGANLSQLVAAQFQTQTGHDPGQLVVRHFEVCDTQRGSNTRTETICVATRRGFILKIVESLRAAKLDVVGGHSEHIALCRALPLLVGDTDAPTVALDLGYGATKLVITHGDKPVFAKTIEIAGRTMDEAASEQLGCGVVAARTRRLRAESLTAAQPAPAPAEDAAETATAVATQAKPAAADAAPRLDLTDQIEALTDEISMCLRYHAALFPETPAPRAVFVGGEARHEGLCRELARGIRLSAHVAEPLTTLEGAREKGRAVNINLEESQPGWAVPLGLCLSPADI